MRFTTVVDENGFVHILDSGIDVGQYRICNQLNSLYNRYLKLKDENEELKKRLEVIK